jgi:hypothetical protein
MQCGDEKEKKLRIARNRLVADKRSAEVGRCQSGG